MRQLTSEAVNTRSVYHDLIQNQRNPDNLSLCPILDLANHHFDDGRATTRHPIPTFHSPSECHLKQGDEVFLKYGTHSNPFLFQHYGFVCDGEMEKSISVDDAFDRVILSVRSAKSRERIEALLQEADYWR